MQIIHIKVIPHYLNIMHVLQYFQIFF